MNFARTSAVAIAFIISFSLFYFSCRTTKPEPEITSPAPEVLPEDTPEPETETIPVLPDFIPDPAHEFRAVWVATVANIDWPSEPGLPVEQQKQEMIDILNRAAALHFNAVILQVRAAADALYNSPYEPWSYFLTGKMGQPPLPAYDPLGFAVSEAHKRGIELHAWFNPYRALHPANQSDISPDHISKTNPSYVHEYGDFLWMDPGLPEVRERTISVIMDVVERYDIDGVHFDDYFYPYPSYAGGADFPDGASWQRARENGATLSRGDWRRENVNLLMKELSERIKETKPHVKFGISPFGIWRPGYPENTTGFDAYEQLYADARLWLKEGWVDYFTPQIYYRIDQIPQPFPVMLQWWVEQNDHNRHMWPGLFTSRIRTTGVTWPTEEITGQVYTARGFPEVTGSVHFSMRTFMENSGNINQKMAAGPHAQSSLIPPSGWMGDSVPSKPDVIFQDYGPHWSLYIHAAPEQNVRWHVIRSKINGKWEVEVIPGRRLETAYYGGEAMVRPDTLIVTSVNRIGLESNPEMVLSVRQHAPKDSVFDFSSLNIIKRNEWAMQPPGGYNANAIRRNLLKGDTLRFRDLTVVVSGMVSSITPPDYLFKADVQPENGDESRNQSDSVQLKFFRNGVSETMNIMAGDAFNWYGFHIGLLDFNLNNGMIQLEIATTGSLPVNRASARTTGEASERLRVPHNINRITLHHTGSAEPLRPDDDPKQVLRGLYNWGASERNWWDVPYHFLIDLDGNIYEGRDFRYAGETNTTYDPRGHLLISVMGNYNLQQPEEAQIDAIVKLMAASVHTFDLTTDDIFGHKDWTDTTCPGEYLAPLLRSDVFKNRIINSLDEINNASE